jgi:hypothetical protein
VAKLVKAVVFGVFLLTQAGCFESRPVMCEVWVKDEPTGGWVFLENWHGRESDFPLGDIPPDEICERDYDSDVECRNCKDEQCLPASARRRTA